jgi:2'-hydroxyisoflavone reductase
MAAMRILILGGTVFLGRAVTDAALARGHAVTHLHRGISSPPDPRVATVIGDRASEPFPPAPAMQRWDAVIDTSGYLPQVVARSAQALASGGRYLFVSSISAYSGEGFHEDAPLQAAPDPLPDAWTPETYGGLKAACEAIVRARFGERALVVRPGLIVGPHDPTDRFTWWPARIARGGRVAAPGRPERTVQFIDVRAVRGMPSGRGIGRAGHVARRDLPRGAVGAPVDRDAALGARVRPPCARFHERADRARPRRRSRVPSPRGDRLGYAALVDDPARESRLEGGPAPAARERVAGGVGPLTHARCSAPGCGV